MNDILSNIIVNVCSILNKHSVQYLVVGGTAVALHGYFRQSINLSGVVAEKPDVDIWYNPTYDNYFRLLNAFEMLGQNVKEFKEEQAPNPQKSFFKFDFDHFTADFLPQIKAALKFKSCFEKREVVLFRETEIPFIGYEDLIIDKEINARPKDKNDIKHLRNRKD